MSGYLNCWPPGYSYLILEKMPPTCIGLCYYQFFLVSDPTDCRFFPIGEWNSVCLSEMQISWHEIIVRRIINRIWTIIMELSGNMHGEITTLLSSLYGILDRYKGLLLGCTWQEYQIRLAINLHRGLHGACSKQLTKEIYNGALQEASAAFCTIYI